MFKKIACILFVLSSPIALASTENNNTQQCEHYLTHFKIKDIPNEATPALQQCFKENSCAGALGMKVNHCAQLLNQWQANSVYQASITPPPSMKTSKSKTPAEKYITQPKVKTPKKQSVSEESTPKKNTDQNTNQKNNNEPSINWF